MFNLDENLRKLTAKYAKKKVKPSDIKENTDLILDLGYDSITVIRLITDCEIKFNIEFDEEYLNITSIGKYNQLEDYIGKKTEKNEHD